MIIDFLRLSFIRLFRNKKDVHSTNYDTASVESTFKSDELDGYIDLVYANYSILPSNVVGEKFDADDIGFAICPIDFLPSSEAFNLLVDEKNFYLDMNY